MYSTLAMLQRYFDVTVADMLLNLIFSQLRDKMTLASVLRFGWFLLL